MFSKLTVFSKTRQRSSTSKFMARINTVIMYTYMVKILHRVWRSSRLPCTQEWWYPALVALALGEQWWRCQFPPWGGRDRCRGRHNGKRKIDPHALTIHQTLNGKKALAEMQGARESLSAHHAEHTVFSSHMKFGLYTSATGELYEGLPPCLGVDKAGSRETWERMCLSREKVSIPSMKNWGTV